MNSKRILVIVGIIALVGVLGYVFVGNNQKQEEAETSSVTKVSVVLDWFPWTAHAGLFIAQDKGYFAQEGLDVELRAPSDPATVLQTVALGRDDFGISYHTDSLIAREKGVQVVSIMGLVQHPLVTFAALEESGIVRPRQLGGKKIGTPGTAVVEVMLDAMLKYDGVTGGIKEVEMVSVGFDLVPALIGKQVDASLAYSTYEVIIAENQGFPVNIMRVEDYGIPDFYELVLVTSEDKIANDPDVIQRFVRAAIRGYEDAEANPQGAVETLKRLNPEVDLSVETKAVELLVPLWIAENGVFGWQEETKWMEFAKWMRENGLISVDVDAREAFTNRFVEHAR